MAKVYLDSTDIDYKISNNGTKVVGTDGANDSVAIAAGVTGTVVSSTIEQIDLAGAVADYKFKQGFGENIEVQDSAGNVMFTMTGVAGKSLSFKDGTVELTYTDSTISVGGTVITTTAAAADPVTIDTTNVTSLLSAAEADALATTNYNNAVTAYNEAKTTATTSLGLAETAKTNALADTTDLTLAQTSLLAAQTAQIDAQAQVNAADLIASTAAITASELDDDTSATTNEAQAAIDAADTLVTTAEEAVTVADPQAAYEQDAADALTAYNTAKDDADAKILTAQAAALDVESVENAQASKDAADLAKTAALEAQAKATLLAEATALTTIEDDTTAVADSLALSDTADALVSTADTAVTTAAAVAPTFTSDTTVTAIAEDTATGTEVLTVTATDNSDAAVTYSINNANFAIDPTSGVITTAAALDFETLAAEAIIVTATDADTNTETQNLTINITNVNEAAIITGATTGTVTEDASVPATGTLLSTDVDADNADNTFTAVTDATASTYGSYTVTAEGTWTYTLDDANATVDALTATDTATDTFDVTSVDGTAQTITITINGSDAPSEINHDNDNTNQEFGGTAGVVDNFTYDYASQAQLDADDIQISAAGAGEDGSDTITGFVIGEDTITFNDVSAAVTDSAGFSALGLTVKNSGYDLLFYFEDSSTGTTAPILTLENFTLDAYNAGFSSTANGIGQSNDDTDGITEFISIVGTENISFTDIA